MAVVEKSTYSYPTAYTTSGSINGTRYRNAIGKGADTSAVSGNDYSNGSSSSTAHIDYSFEFDIPSTATIVSVECRVKGHCENTSRSTATLQLYAGSTAKGSSSKFTSTSAQTVTLTTGTWSRSEIDNMVLRFTIGYYGGLVNGATVTVTYSYNSVTYTVTSTLTGEGTIQPSGATEVENGEEYTLTITPTNKSDTVTATKNGTDITADLVAHGAGDTLSFAADNVTTSGIQSGASYAEYCIGYSAENPNDSSDNMYASRNANGYASYSFDFSSIPLTATIESVEVRAYGHRESSTISSTYVSQCVLYENSTAISDEVDFPSTYDSLITLTPSRSLTRSELNNLTLRHYVGYYGGLVNGITVEVTYSTGSGIDHYTYTFTTTGDTTIAVVIGESAEDVLMIKVNDAYKSVITGYKKVNGAWVAQSDISALYEYINGLNVRKGA